MGKVTISEFEFLSTFDTELTPSSFLNLSDGKLVVSAHAVTVSIRTPIKPVNTFTIAGPAGNSSRAKSGR